jgi:hypothetical protein
MDFKRLFWILVLITAFLLIMYILSPGISEEVATKFDLAWEANIPAWYSSILLAAVSLAAFLVWFHSRRSRRGDKLDHFFWLMVSAGFLFMSLDESACLHEMLDDLLSMKWLYIYGPIAAVVLIFCVYYIMIRRKDRGHLRNWILPGLMVLGFGSLFMEFLDYVFWPLPPVYMEIENMLEEGFEMLGTSMVLIGCLKELLPFCPILGKQSQP